MSPSRLFSPLTVGRANLKHRIVMAPLTRLRADPAGVPTDAVSEYYAQRTSIPGTLLIAESTFISPRASGMTNTPGIWSPDQIAAWKKVTTAVHDKGCFIFLQLWAPGSRADPAVLARAPSGPYSVVSASDIPISPDGPIPHALTTEQIQSWVGDYATAAKNAMTAGFDGVEIHGANGYLPDQFLKIRTNNRTDEYGGSVENRSRFTLEVTRAVIDAVGDSKKVAMRLSPWTDYTGTGYTEATGREAEMAQITEQTSHVVLGLKKLDLGYLHLVESRYEGSVADAKYHVLTKRNDEFIKLWGPETPIILAGGFTAETARRATDEVYASSNMCVAFGRFYISTPDLPYRVRENIPLNPYNRATFYLPMSPKGYTDYPFSEEYLRSAEGQDPTAKA